MKPFCIKNLADMHKYVNVRKCVQILSEWDSSMLDNIQIMTAIAIASLKT